MSTELLYREEVYAIMGAAIEVHRVLGPGFAEPVYQEALGKELARRQIPFEPQAPLGIEYKGEILEKEYRADFVCYGKIVLELKALDRLTSKRWRKS